MVVNMFQRPMKGLGPHFTTRLYQCGQTEIQNQETGTQAGNVAGQEIPHSTALLNSRWVQVLPSCPSITREKTCVLYNTVGGQELSVREVTVPGLRREIGRKRGTEDGGQGTQAVITALCTNKGNLGSRQWLAAECSGSLPLITHHSHTSLQSQDIIGMHKEKFFTSYIKGRGGYGTDTDLTVHTPLISTLKIQKESGCLFKNAKQRVCYQWRGTKAGE